MTRRPGDEIIVATTYQRLRYWPPVCGDAECSRCVRWLTRAQWAALERAFAEATRPDGANSCEECGAVLAAPSTVGLRRGRPALRRYCGATCRQRDYRRRRAALERGEPLPAAGAGGRPIPHWLPPGVPRHTTHAALRRLAPADPDYRDPYRYHARPGESEGAFAARMKAEEVRK